MPLFVGRGGVEWDIDIPTEGTHRRESFDRQVELGELVPVEKATKRAPAKHAQEAAD